MVTENSLSGVPHLEIEGLGVGWADTTLEVLGTARASEYLRHAMEAEDTIGAFQNRNGLTFPDRYFATRTPWCSDSVHVRHRLDLKLVGPANGELLLQCLPMGI